MSRRLVAVLACRIGGARLFGKPLQSLAPGRPILAHIVEAIRATPAIDDVVLAVAEGRANRIFLDLAEELGLAAVTGSETDVLGRLITAAKAAGADDVLRITSECPFTWWEAVPGCLARHRARGNDVTLVDRLPLGCHFELYRAAALGRAHAEGGPPYHNEYCSSYFIDHPARFRIEPLLPPPALQRPELRLTVDHPEDLMLCRAVMAELGHLAPRVPLPAIIALLDRRPELPALVRAHADATASRWPAPVIDLAA